MYLDVRTRTCFVKYEMPREKAAALEYSSSFQIKPLDSLLIDILQCVCWLPWKRRESQLSGKGWNNWREQLQHSSWYLVCCYFLISAAGVILFPQRWTDFFFLSFFLLLCLRPCCCCCCCCCCCLSLLILLILLFRKMTSYHGQQHTHEWRSS